MNFIHISTDAVFDGTKEGMYTEEDEPSPQGVYSQTKLDGEHAVGKLIRRQLLPELIFTVGH